MLKDLEIEWSHMF